jgi:hypothetical protein
VYSIDRGVAHVADFFFADLASFDWLFAEFSRLMRRQRALAIVVTYVGPGQLAQRLKRFGFWKRPSDWKVMLYADRNRLGNRYDLLLDPENWYLTRADTDTDL